MEGLTVKDAYQHYQANLDLSKHWPNLGLSEAQRQIQERLNQSEDSFPLFVDFLVLSLKQLSTRFPDNIIIGFKHRYRYLDTLLITEIFSVDFTLSEGVSCQSILTIKGLERKEEFILSFIDV